jgi:hypothetical protein
MKPQPPSVRAATTASAHSASADPRAENLTAVDYP